MSNFSEFLNHDEEFIRRIAGVLNELTESLEGKAISKQDYDELVDDLLDMEKIDNLCDTMERKQKAEVAFKALAAIVGKII